MMFFTTCRTAFAASSLVAVAIVVAGAAASTSRHPPHILLIVTDQFRYDAFHPAVTPNLHKLALHPDSTTFQNAYTSTPTCTPARAGLLTGKSPWNHGMLGYGMYTDCREYPITLPEALSKFGGYRTYVSGKNHFGYYSNNERTHFISQGYEHLKIYDGLTEIDDDYDKYFKKEMPGVNPMSCGMGWNEWRACPYQFDEHLHPTAWATRKALAFLESHFGKEEETEDDPESPVTPIFLKLSYHRPHSPYDPPKRLFDKHLENPISERFVNNTSWDVKYLNTTAPMGRSAWYGDPGTKAAQHTRAGYMASAEFVDEHVEKVFDWLKRRNLFQNFFVAWTSDHGDMNGDHNLWRKGYPWEGSAHIAMMMKLPSDVDPEFDSAASVSVATDSFSSMNPSGRVSKFRGAVSKAIVENRDIAPTLYDMAGILQDVQELDPLLNGKSLVEVLRGKKIYVRNWLDLEHAAVYNITNHWNALVGYDEDEDDKKKLWKYVFFATTGEEQLFCLTDDPMETYDLSRLKGIEVKLQSWREKMVEQFLEEGRGQSWVKDGKLCIREKSVTFGPNYPCDELTAVEEATQMFMEGH